MLCVWSTQFQATLSTIVTDVATVYRPALFRSSTKLDDSMIFGSTAIFFRISLKYSIRAISGPFKRARDCHCHVYFVWLTSSNEQVSEKSYTIERKLVQIWRINWSSRNWIFFSFDGIYKRNLDSEWSVGLQRNKKRYQKVWNMSCVVLWCAVLLLKWSLR